MSIEKEIYPENMPDSAMNYITFLQQSVQQLTDALYCIDENGLQSIHISVVKQGGEAVVSPGDMAAKSIIGEIGKQAIVAAITNEIARINKIKRSVVSQYENPDYS